MITELLHRLATRPWVYDQIQSFAGLERVHEKLSKGIAALSPKVIVDIGGGTGNVRNLFGPDCRYVCLDVELPKLTGFRSKIPGGLAVLADATSVPIINSWAGR